MEFDREFLSIQSEYIQPSPHRDLGVLPPEVHDALLQESHRQVISRAKDSGAIRFTAPPVVQAGIDRALQEGQAVELVRAEFNVSKGALEYDAKLLTPADIPNMRAPDPSQRYTGADAAEQWQQDALNTAAFVPSDFDLECKKRRFVNALIQGGAHGAQQSFLLDPHLPEQERNDLKKHMEHGDLLYWTIPTQAQEQMAAAGHGVAGLSQLDFSTEPVTVRAQAIAYPILVHELAKGTLEYLALSGLPEDDNLRGKVLAVADGAEYEQWDLRLGVSLWKRFVDRFETEDRPLRAEVFHKLVSLPAPEFFAALQDVANKQAAGPFDSLLRKARVKRSNQD